MRDNDAQGSSGLSVVSSVIADIVVLPGSSFSLQGITGAAAVATTSKIALIE